MLSTIHNTSEAAQFTATTFARYNSATSPYGLPLPDHCVSDTLHAHHPSLAEESLAHLDRIAHTTSYPEGALIFVEGQMPRGVYVLCQGSVKLTTSSRDGKTLILKIVRPGEMLGLHSIVTGKAYETTAETLQPSQFAFVKGSDFLRFISERGDACMNVAMQLSTECQAAYEGVRSMGLSHSVAEKLARLVLQWCEGSQPHNGSMRIKVALTHEEIAQLIGTSRESVTRTLGELKKQRVLELSGSTLFIRNMAALEALVMG